MENFDKYYAVRSVTFDLTNACNLQCSYCFEKDKNPCSMTAENALKMAEAVDQNFRKRVLVNQPGATLRVTFFGGEPMLKMDVMRAVAKFFMDQEYFVEFAITTNLTLLKDEDIEFFRSINMGILVSIDGTKEAHDKNRCNSYDLVANNIKKLVDAGMQLNLEARITLPPSEVGTLVEGVKGVFELGVDNIAPCLVYDQPWKKEDWVIFEDQTRKLFDWALEVYNNSDNKRNLNIKMLNDALENCLVKSNENEVPCGMGNDLFIAVSPEGNVAPCHQIPTNKSGHGLIMGNILTDEFDEKRIMETRAKRDFSQRCQACDNRGICSGGCPVENYRASGSFSKPEPAWCEYIAIMAKIIVEYQDRILNATNLRNRRLVVLKENLKLQEILYNIIEMDVDSPLVMVELAKVQQFLFNNEQILMPAFKDMAKAVITTFQASLQDKINEKIQELDLDDERIKENG